MPTLLVGTDFSTRSDRALRRAVLIARTGGWDMIVAAVVDDDQPARMIEAQKREARALLDELSRTTRELDGVSCRTELRVGEPFIALPEAAEATGASLMILGPHRRQLLQDQFRGTTVERALRRASMPVIVANGVPSGQYQRLLIAADLEPYSEAGAKALDRMSFLRNVERILLHVYDSAGSAMMGRALVSGKQREADHAAAAAAARRSLAQFIETATIANVLPVVRMCGGSAASEIRQAAVEHEADLIILTVSDKSGLAKAVLGSTVEAVLRDSERDVMVVPASG